MSTPVSAWRHYIIRHKLTEEDALTVESVLIDFLIYKEFNTESLLTNIVAGHHQWNEGIKKGVVRCVLKPTTKWLPFKHAAKGGRFTIRYYIEGIIDDEEGNELYLNKDVTAYPFPFRGAIRYVNSYVK